MSDIARFWSRNLHGLNVAEHAICRELAEYHNSEMDVCFPNMQTLCEIYECSRPYLKKILNRLDTWNIVTRVEWFDAMARFRQTSNRYKLNLKRHFPDPAPEGRTTRDKNKSQKARPYDNRDFLALAGAKVGKRALVAFRSKLPERHRPMLDGIREAFHDSAAKTLFVTVDDERCMKDFLTWLPDLSQHSQKELQKEFRITPIALYFPRPKKR